MIQGILDLILQSVKNLVRNNSMSARSERNLATVRPDLQRVIRRAWMMRGNLDFEVICGHRGEAAQIEAYKSGYSKLNWPYSKHNRKPSWAVDVIPKPIPRTSAGWNTPEYLEKFDKLARIIIAAANVEKVALEWGGRWPMRDLPHWEVVE